MSDNIPPFEIQAEIIKRVSDVKSLLQFRSVSKSWKSFIDSSRFIAGYHQSQPPRHHIFVWYHVQFVDNFVSIIDNDDDDDDNSHSFAQHKVPLPIPSSLQSHDVDVDWRVIGSSSKGLICFYEHSYRDRVVLWNPTIRKSVTIDVPKASYEYTMGFGVSPYSNDPKLVKIQRFGNALDDLKPRQAKLYSLSTGEWRTLSEDLPRSSVAFYDHDQHVAIGNFIFWLAHEKATGMKREMIILFDMISEKFMEIHIPDHVVTENAYNELCLFKIQESLVVAVIQNYGVLYHVWMMEGGVSDSFTKMYSIIRPDEEAFSLEAFRNNGHPIMQIDDDKFKGSDKLVVYEPNSEQFTPIGASESRCTIYAVSYMETLLLLDH